MYDAIIIGAGPAGISAAIQLKRYGIKSALIEKAEIGGLLRNANLVENYPGFPDGISGLELVKLFRKQLENNEINIIKENVLDVNYENCLYKVDTDKNTLQSKFLIIASGTKPEKMDINLPYDSRILHEVHTIRQIKNKEIVIVGAGDAAFDYALSLAERNRVLILNRGLNTKCLPVLRDRISQSNNISYLENTRISSVKAEDKLILHLNQGPNKIQADYLLIAIGREPNLDFINAQFKEKIKSLQNNCLLFMIGDVKNNIYRQTAICAGDGVRAAMEIHKHLKPDIH